MKKLVQLFVILITLSSPSRAAVITNAVKAVERTYLSNLDTTNSELSERVVLKVHLDRPSAIARYRIQAQLKLAPGFPKPGWATGDWVKPMAHVQLFANDGDKWLNTVEVTPGGGLWRVVAGGEAWSTSREALGPNETKDVELEGYFLHDQYVAAGDYLMVITPYALVDEPFKSGEEAKDYTTSVKGSYKGLEFSPSMELSLWELVDTSERPTLKFRHVYQDYGLFIYNVVRATWERQFPGWTLEASDMEHPGWGIPSYSDYVDSEGYDQLLPFEQRPRVGIVHGRLPENCMLRLRYTGVRLKN